MNWRTRKKQKISRGKMKPEELKDNSKTSNEK